jgi:indole-3-acetate monooxygenase
MTATTIGQPTDTAELRDHLMSAVDSIRETLEDCAEEAERSGFYPERGWRAMQDSGLFRMKAPRAVGGHEADPSTQLQVIEEIASIDGGAGWTYMIGVGSLALLAGWVPDEGLKTFLVDGRLPRTALTAAPIGVATPVDGGFRVTGRWPFGSGSAHAERIAGMCRSAADSGPPILACMFLAEDVTLHDNWQVNGLRGSGSQDFSVTDLFVPHEHAFDVMGPAARGGAMYRIGIPGFVMIDHAGFALGVGRHAIQAMTAFAQTKMRGVVKPVGVASLERFQFDLGRCQIMLDAARSQMHAVCRKAWDLAQDGEVRSPGIQLQLQCSAIYATEVAGEVCRTLFRYGGGKSLYVGNALEQCLRDIQAAAQHGLLNAENYGSLGQVALGFQEITPR